MDLTRRQTACIVAAIILLAAVTPMAVVVAESFLGDFFTASTGVHLKADNGPTVETSKQYQLRSGNPFTATSVNLSTESNGHVNLSSVGSTEVKVDEINGTWTNVSELDVSTTELTIDPDDKPAAGISGSANSFTFRTGIAVDDDTTDFIYTSTGGSSAVTIRNLEADNRIGAQDADTGETVATGSADGEGTATISGLPSGTHTIELVDAPENITIRDVEEPHNIVKKADVEILVTGSEETVDRQTISDGNVSLDGLPTTEEYIVIVNATDYHRRSVIIEDVFDQSDIFVLNETETAVETALQIDDPTAQFQPGESQVIVQKVINRSLYDDSEPKNYQWTTIGGDRLGADQEYVILLRLDDRYRFIVTNDDGDRRVLGEYSATAAQTVILSIEEVDLVINEENPLAWNATQANVSGTETIKFRYNDSEDETTDLTLKIYERGDPSNEIENTTHSGPFGLFTHDQQLTDDQSNKTWVVEWSATRNGEAIGGSTVVGVEQDLLLTDLDDWLKNFIAVGSVIFVGFAAGGVRMEAGAVLASLLSAIWYYVGFMPPEITGGIIALSMATAIAIYTRGGRRF